MRMRGPSIEMQQQMEALYQENEHLTREIAILRDTIKVWNVYWYGNCNNCNCFVCGVGTGASHRDSKANSTSSRWEHQETPGDAPEQGHGWVVFVCVLSLLAPAQSVPSILLTAALGEVLHSYSATHLALSHVAGEVSALKVVKVLGLIPRVLALFQVKRRNDRCSSKCRPWPKSRCLSFIVI